MRHETGWADGRTLFQKDRQVLTPSRLGLLLWLLLAGVSSGQAAKGGDPVGQSNQAGASQQTTDGVVQKPPPVQIRQTLDVDSAALAKVPADPLVEGDPFGAFPEAVREVARSVARGERVKFTASYTLLDQYAATVPDGVDRHNQGSGRLDFTANWAAYDHGKTAGSVFLLVRSGTNLGVSQQFNLSDQLGSGVFLNCLQGGGAQRPITLNILYWRQDFWSKRLSFYLGKIHPNEYISLSMYNNDERTQFLNGENDGNLAVASDGTYAGGAAVEVQATRHIYVHALAVDTEGSQYTNIKTLEDRKYLEAIEAGWFTGSPGSKYSDFRLGMYREDTKNLGSGYGGAFAFEHEFENGWAPFAKVGFATPRGTSIRQTDTLGVVQTHPFGRHGDMFGASLSYTEPNFQGKHHESIFETFYRLRLTRSVEVGPDMEVSIHPTYATQSAVRALVSARARIIF
ncbi:carbohydrate porin [Granulicella sibirica]|uniref:carbohydrate porin n=1 Tax=Granulicella sibirica TaxID=2479048 RepID=UPI001F4FF001|nr:carbohydrate porin [Granulicella sibirica]